MMRRVNDDQLRLGIFFPSMSGPHVISRAVAATNPDVTDPSVQMEVARTCEEVGLDYIFLADSWSNGPHCVAANFHDPVWYPPLLLGALAACTSHIGLVSTLHTSLHDASHIARIGATLDHLSGGRWGINVVSGGGGAEELFHLEPLDHDGRYLRAQQLTDSLPKLWKGEHAVIDQEFVGVDGALNVPLPVQAQPLVISAGTSEAGIAFAAQSADWLFISGPDPKAVRARIQQADDEATRCGRPPHSIRPMMLGDLVVRTTDEEAELVRQDIRSKIDLDAAREFAIGISGSIDAYKKMFDDGGDDAELLRDYGMRLGRQQFYGSPETVAEKIIRVHTDFGAKGIAFSFPYWSPANIKSCLEPVMALLEDAGVWTNPHRRGWSWG